MSAIFFFFPAQQLAAALAIESFLLLGLLASPLSCKRLSCWARHAAFPPGLLSMPVKRTNVQGRQNVRLTNRYSALS